MTPAKRDFSLYLAALLADENYDAVIARRAPGKNRWLLTKAEAADPEILQAYAAKVSADVANLKAIRGEP